MRRDCISVIGSAIGKPVRDGGSRGKCSPLGPLHEPKQKSSPSPPTGKREKTSSLVSGFWVRAKKWRTVLRQFSGAFESVLSNASESNARSCLLLELPMGRVPQEEPLFELVGTREPIAKPVH